MQSRFSHPNQQLSLMSLHCSCLVGGWGAVRPGELCQQLLGMLCSPRVMRVPVDIRWLRIYLLSVAIFTASCKRWRFYSPELQGWAGEHSMEK